MHRAFLAMAVITLAVLGAKPAGAATGKCTSIPAQCAIEIGGRCNPVTGRWIYGPPWIGGTNRGGAFDQCVARKLRERRGA
jgi:hypothetical protein